MIKQGRLDRPYNGVVDCTVRTFKSEGTFWECHHTHDIKLHPIVVIVNLYV
jgi:solute carrier family 25 (adenine nucleotide translocator) protein 4/5/6/31